MNVLVIGAHGQVGKHVVDKVKEYGHNPVAMIRDTDQIPYFEERNVQTVLADLQGDFRQAFYNIDAVIFAAGSGPHTGADKTIIIDQEAAIKSMELAREFGVKRYVMLSSIAANRPEIGPSALKHYLYAKGRADEYLRHTDLVYTIVRPGGLTNDAGNGKVYANETINQRGTIPREDVASVLAHVLTVPHLERISFDLLSGDHKIEEMFAK
ncbi:NAD(P)H-binding protein [Pontibacillus yanchengensis]|uniref:NAD(P)H-binding protein n=2 Tax=Pontibacillus yanchengensis TaxID=462910 RepID=A0ACC7VKJ3_9BACI|nr:SDR family oxidoreductase [Pontibacillus yanchengensis]MYL35069.1 NAD(P)H-binding protein [Pontibacillus yanchengensis]MYL55220.1 NAD(P)H-binding protein [Pontibacillus yanchengensis]